MTNRLLVRGALITVVALTLLAAIPSYAATIPQCTAIETNGSVALSLLLAGGADAGGCEVGDKIFSGITYSGSNLASNVFVTFATNGAIPTEVEIGFTEGGAGTAWSSLSLAYTTTVDTTLCSTCVLTQALDEIFTPPTPNTVAGVFSHSPAGSPNPIDVDGLSPSDEIGQASLANLTSVRTFFTQTGGTQLDEVSSSFKEGPTGVPEPATVGLLGLGLAVLAAIRKKAKSA